MANNPLWADILNGPGGEQSNQSSSGGQSAGPGAKPILGTVSNDPKKKKKQAWTPYQTDRMISPYDMSSGEADDGQ